MSHIVTKEELIKANGGNTISNTLVRSENKKIVVLTNILYGTLRYMVIINGEKYVANGIDDAINYYNIKGGEDE